MKINVIATGSSGNLYELYDNQNNSILIEAGVPVATYMKFKEALKPPEMCIVSHMHGDHAGFAKEYSNLMPVHISEDRCISESFRAMGFSVIHGGEKCTAYIIKSLVEDKFLFFGTDFEYSEGYLEMFDMLVEKNVSIFLIECNYNDYLYHLASDDQRIGCDRHLSDNDVVRFIKKLKPLNPIIITIHGSNRLSADNYTKKYIGSKILDATVSVATGAKGGSKNLFIL